MGHVAEILTFLPLQRNQKKRGGQDQTGLRPVKLRRERFDTNYIVTRHYKYLLNNRHVAYFVAFFIVCHSKKGEVMDGRGIVSRALQAQKKNIHKNLIQYSDKKLISKALRLNLTANSPNNGNN